MSNLLEIVRSELEARLKVSQAFLSAQDKLNKALSYPQDGTAQIGPLEYNLTLFVGYCTSNKLANNSNDFIRDFWRHVEAGSKEPAFIAMDPRNYAFEVPFDKVVFDGWIRAHWPAIEDAQISLSAHLLEDGQIRLAHPSEVHAEALHKAHEAAIGATQMDEALWKLIPGAHRKEIFFGRIEPLVCKRQVVGSDAVFLARNLHDWHHTISFGREDYIIRSYHESQDSPQEIAWSLVMKAVPSSVYSLADYKSVTENVTWDQIGRIVYLHFKHDAISRTVEPFHWFLLRSQIWEFSDLKQDHKVILSFLERVADFLAESVATGALSEGQVAPFVEAAAQMGSWMNLRSLEVALRQQLRTGRPSPLLSRFLSLLPP